MRQSSKLQKNMNKSTCSACEEVFLGSKSKRSRTPILNKPAKRRKTICTPAKTQRTVGVQTSTKSKAIPTHSGFLPEAATKLLRANYKGALSIMCRRSASFTTHMVKAISKKVLKEATSLEKKGTFKPGVSKIDSYKQLNWKNVQKDLQETCPILLQILQSLLPGGRQQTHLQRIPIITAISVLMFQRKPSQNKVIQELIGIMLWFSGCRNDTFERLNQLGVSVGMKSATRCIDMIKDSFDADLKRQKEAIERVYGQAQSSPNRRRLCEEPCVSSEEGLNMDQVNIDADHPADGLSRAACNTPSSEPHPPHHDSTLSLPAVDADHPDDGLSRPDCNTPTSEPHPPPRDSELSLPDGEKADISSKHLGFTMVCDYVNQHTSTKCPSTDDSNRQFNLIQSYAAVDRVPCFHLSDVHPSLEEIEAISGDEDVFLPSEEDIELLRMEYLITIKRILSSHIPVFKDMDVVDHIPHPHSCETKKRSTIIPLGVLQKEETKDQSEMADVLDHFTQYVPKDSSSQPISLLLYGNQESCERHRDAQNARVNEESNWDRLSGFRPAIQEWHKRVLTLQDSFALLYDASSVRSCGTLSYIKNSFGHTNVTEKIPDCFDDATGLLRFTTKGYVLAAALHHMGITSVDEEPEDGIPADVKAYFDQICHKVLDLAFHPLHQKPFLGEEDIPLHQPSPKQREPASSQPSVEDGPSSSRRFCLCRSFKEEDMIGCDNPSCERGGWFHYSCVSLTKSKVPKGEWFCCGCCKRQAGRGRKSQTPVCRKSHKFEYTKAVLFHGLGEMVRHDAIQEGDGNRIIAHWRFDMLQFYLNHHWKYLMEGHRLLMDVNGAVSPRLAYQLTWNRTVNIHGGSGNNISMDLQMEFLNKDYKEFSESAVGNLTDNVIQRCSQATGLKAYVTRLFDRKGSGKKDFCKKSTESSQDNDTIELAEMLLHDRCLEEEPGRCHAGFERFEFQQEFTRTRKFLEKMAKFSRKRIKREKLFQL